MKIETLDQDSNEIIQLDKEFPQYVYLLQNGYSWFVSDAVFTTYFDIRIKQYLKKDKFLVIRLKVNRKNKTAIVTFEDGNNNVLVTHFYNHTDAKVEELVLYYVNGVLMLRNEY